MKSWVISHSCFLSLRCVCKQMMSQSSVFKIMSTPPPTLWLAWASFHKELAPTLTTKLDSLRSLLFLTCLQLFLNLALWDVVDMAWVIMFRLALRFGLALLKGQTFILPYSVNIYWKVFAWIKKTNVSFLCSVLWWECKLICNYHEIETQIPRFQH